MFRKLVSNLPFSPALVGQIGFYARRLRKEEATRRLGLFMTVLALIVQSLTVFIPSSSANASNVSDMISGGVASVSDILRAYDSPNTDYKKIMDYAGISRSEIASLTKSTINSIDYGKASGAWQTWGRVHKFSAAQGEVEHNISGTVVYSKPLWLYDSTSWTTVHGSTYNAFVGTSAKIGRFAIVMGCGNIVTRTVPTPPKPITVCRPGVGIINIMSNEKKSTDLPADDPACQPKTPVATCQSITPPVTIDRTHYSFTAKATTQDGATINGYVFKVYNAAGTVMATKSITSSATQVESGSIQIATAGAYHVTVTVQTSLGERKGTSCETNVTVPEEGKVTVCRPGTGIITVSLSEKKSTDLLANDAACQPKTAVCTNIVINKTDRTHMSVTANASGTAAISSYVFTVRKDNASGAIVATKTTTSTAQKVTSDIFDLKDNGTYYVSVVVKTAIGDAKDLGCAGTFTVVPPDMCDVNPTILKTNPDCKPCPGNSSLWYKAPECREVIVENKTATNLTQGTDATTTVAKAGDRIQYTLTVTNPGKVPATANFTEPLSDVLEYASIQDNGGGTYNPDSRSLSWTSTQLAAGEKQTRTFVVALPAKIPSTAQGSSEPASYDCIMNNTFGNNVQVRVNCETPKIVEQTIKQLPSTGPTENMLFACALLAIVTFFWARSKQLGSEVRLIRKDFSASTI